MVEQRKKRTASRLRVTAVLAAICVLWGGSFGCSDETEPQVNWTEPFDAFDMGWFLCVNQSADYGAVAVGGSPSEGIIMRMNVIIPLLIDWLFALKQAFKYIKNLIFIELAHRNTLGDKPQLSPPNTLKSNYTPAEIQIKN